MVTGSIGTNHSQNAHHFRGRCPQMRVRDEKWSSAFTSHTNASIEYNKHSPSRISQSDAEHANDQERPETHEPTEI